MKTYGAVSYGSGIDPTLNRASGQSSRVVKRVCIQCETASVAGSNQSGICLQCRAENTRPTLPDFKFSPRLNSRYKSNLKEARERS